jgi:uncharacterized protein (DUF697 family)
MAQRPDPKTGELFALPRGPREVRAAVRLARALVTKRAALASASSLVPIPGLDLATDIATLVSLISRINQIFGLTPEQIGNLGAQRQAIVYQAILVAGSAMIGKIVTSELVFIALKKVGMKLTVKQVTKFVPLAGQVLSAMLSFAALRYVCNQHIQECVGVVENVGAQERKAETI